MTKKNEVQNSQFINSYNNNVKTVMETSVFKLLLILWLLSFLLFFVQTTTNFKDEFYLSSINLPFQGLIAPYSLCNFLKSQQLVPAAWMKETSD